MSKGLNIKTLYEGLKFELEFELEINERILERNPQDTKAENAIETLTKIIDRYNKKIGEMTNGRKEEI